jgi:hypothetical protein
VERAVSQGRLHATFESLARCAKLANLGIDLVVQDPPKASCT